MFFSSVYSVHPSFCQLCGGAAKKSVPGRSVAHPLRRLKRVSLFLSTLRAGRNSSPPVSTAGRKIRGETAAKGTAHAGPLGQNSNTLPRRAVKIKLGFPVANKFDSADRDLIYIHIGSFTLAERPKRELKQTLARHHVAIHSSPNPGQLPGTRLAHGGIAAVLMTHPQHNSCWQRVSTNRALPCTPLRMLSGFTAAFALRFASCVCKLRHS